MKYIPVGIEVPDFVDSGRELEIDYSDTVILDFYFSDRPIDDNDLGNRHIADIDHLSLYFYFHHFLSACAAISLPKKSFKIINNRSRNNNIWVRTLLVSGVRNMTCGTSAVQY